MESILKRILLIEDDEDHAQIILRHFKRSGDAIQIDWEQTLQDGLKRFEINLPDAILLDLGLPDSSIEKTLAPVVCKAGSVPIVVLSSLEDQDFAIRAVHQGAQDYLSKSRIDGEVLVRSLRYAIERKRIEERLKQADRERDEFLATLSHELRTPVTVIQGFAEILCGKNVSENERQSGLQAILRNSMAQVRLIEDLLDMSRIITGKLVLQSAPQDLVPIIRAAIDSIQLAATSKQIAVETNFDESARMVVGDTVRLSQIFWNLLSNAIKFTPNGGRVVVRVRTSNRTSEIVIEDNGLGIEPDFLPYVFDRFRQQDSSIRRKLGGLGLGLAIVKYLVEHHGGDVEAASDGLGQGSRFTIRLPLVSEHRKENPKTDCTAKPAAPLLFESKISPSIAIDDSDRITKVLQGARILAVDDAPDALLLVTYLLRRHGAEVVTGNSANEAAQVLSHTTPDIIVCDIGMPDEDGYSFMRKVRAQAVANGSQRIPAVALTAYVRPEEREECYRAGFDAHLPKPIAENILVQTVSDLLKLAPFTVADEKPL